MSESKLHSRFHYSLSYAAGCWLVGQWCHVGHANLLFITKINRGLACSNSMTLCRDHLTPLPNHSDPQFIRIWKTQRFASLENTHPTYYTHNSFKTCPTFHLVCILPYIYSLIDIEHSFPLMEECDILVEGNRQCDTNYRLHFVSVLHKSVPCFQGDYWWRHNDDIMMEYL